MILLLYRKKKYSDLASTLFWIHSAFKNFHFGERRFKQLRTRMPDSPDTQRRKPNPQRKRCEFKNIPIRVNGAFGQRREFQAGYLTKGRSPHCKTNTKYVKSKEKLPRMISCLFPYWEEGNHDGHKKGYTVVHLGDRSFPFFMAIKRPVGNAQGLFSVLLPSTNPALLDLPRAKRGIIKTRNHNHGNAARLGQKYAHL